MLKTGKAYMPAAPMTTKAGKDIAIAHIRRVRPFGNEGCLPSCVSLFGVPARGSFSDVSATYVRLRSMKQGKSHRCIVLAMAPLRDCPLKPAQIMGLYG